MELIEGLFPPLLTGSVAVFTHPVPKSSPGLRCKLYCCCLVVVVDSWVTVFSADPSGLLGLGLTSVLRVLLVDSVVVVGAGCAGAAAVVGGADCWQPVSVRPMVTAASPPKNL